MDVADRDGKDQDRPVDEAAKEAPIDAPAGLRKASRKAQKVGKDPSRVRRLLAEAAVKAGRSRERLGDAWHDLQTLFRLLRAWVGGRYRSVPWRVVVLSIAALLYFVNPFDLIPDFLGFGLLDDIGVIGFAMSQMRSDLERFRDWEEAHGRGPDDDGQDAADEEGSGMDADAGAGPAP